MANPPATSRQARTMERGLSEGPEATPKRAEAGFWLLSIRQADIGGELFAFWGPLRFLYFIPKSIITSHRNFLELTNANCIKGTNNDKKPVYINLHNAGTLIGDDSD